MSLETIQPESTDPPQLRSSAPGMGKLMFRFVGLLFLAIAAMALVWSR